MAKTDQIKTVGKLLFLGLGAFKRFCILVSENKKINVLLFFFITTDGFIQAASY